MISDDGWTKLNIVENMIYSEPHCCQTCRFSGSSSRGCIKCKFTGMVSHPKCKCGKNAAWCYAPLSAPYSWNWYCDDCVSRDGYYSYQGEQEIEIFDKGGRRLPDLDEWDSVQQPRLLNKFRKKIRSLKKGMGIIS